MGDCSLKPGWIRLSLHPVMTNDEVLFMANAIKQLAENHVQWADDYTYNGITNEFEHKVTGILEGDIIKDWFDTELI